MAKTPLYPQDILEFFKGSVQNGINPPHLPPGYVMATDPLVFGPLLPRLFDAAFISTGIIDPNRLGTGAVGDGNLYLADDGTWKAVSSGAQDLQSVTNIGNTTTNTIETAGTKSDYFLLDTGAVVTPQQGMMFWDADRQTVGVQMNGVEARLGQDNFWYVKNQTGSPIPKGTAVMAVGALGASSRILVAPMVADGSVEEQFLLGITAEDILNGEDGFVMNIGKIRGIDTTQYGTQAGQVLYCDPANPGGLTITQPQAPNLDIPIAFTVDYKSNGTLAVRTLPGYHLGELHDVYSNSPSNNDILLYNSTNSRWENTPLSSAVPTPTLQTVTDAGNITTKYTVVGSLGLGTSQHPTLQNSNGSLRFNINSTNYGYQWYRGSELMQLVGNGNLLIGTTTDSGYKLQVAGNQLITTTGNTSSTTGFKILNSSGSTMFHVLDNGNVGINIDAQTSTSYRLRVNGGIWANSFEQLYTLNGSAGVGRIEYYNNGGSHRTLGFRTYGSHASEAVKGFVEISSQVLTYSGIGNLVLHADADFADHPTLVLRSLNTAAESFYMQNYHHDLGALFITNAATGGDDSMRFRPGRTSDVLVVSTGGIEVTGSIIKSGGTAAQFLKADGSVDSNTYLTTVPTLDQVTTAGNTTTNAITVGGLTVDTDLIYTDTVNNRVGIGTTGLIPGTLLTINGSVSIAAGQSLKLDPSANIYMVAASTQFRLYTGSIAALSIPNTGNVLINTTTDAGYKLDVNGTLRITNDAYFATTSGNVGIGTTTPSEKLEVVGGRILVNQTVSSDRLLILNSSANVASTIVFQNTLSTDNSLRVGGNGTNLSLYTSNLERLTISSSGNVSIGTTTDSGFKLDVTGKARLLDNSVPNASDINGFSNNTNNYINHSIFKVQSSNNVLHIGSSSVFNDHRTWIQSGDSQIAFPAVGSIALNPIGGNVGVGLMTPAYKLDIYGSTPAVQIKSAGENQDVTLYFNTAFGGTASPKTAIIAKALNSWSRSDLYFCLSSNTSSNTVTATTADARMVILNGGNVGIGTVSPSNTVHIYKNATIGSITSPTVVNAGLRIQDTGSNMYFDGNSIVIDTAGFLTTTGNSDFDIGTNSTSRLTITGAGNIGIGTTSPTQKLDVNGTVRARSFYNLSSIGTDQGIVGDDGFGATIFSLTRRDSNVIRLQTFGDFALFTNGSSGTEKMRVNTAGNVLIGTTTDSGYKLEVNGNVKVSGTIEAVGGTSSNWNTAYSWGDHSTQGYITGTTGFTGVFTVPTNPPGQQNLDIQNGLIVNVF